jgi:hypothetical protein
MVGRGVGIEPTTFGLKDQIRTQPLQSATVSYRKISHRAHTELLCSGLLVYGYPHKSRTVVRSLECLNSEDPVPKTEAESAEAWSADEERTIKTIQQAESVPRAEAIRRMQRRKKISHSVAALTSLKRRAMFAIDRMCRNPRCTKGEDGGPRSLTHLRADARYCDATCKKAVQRSLNRQNRTSNHQSLSGSKRGQFGSLVPPPYQHERGAQIVRNRNHNLLQRTEPVGSHGAGLEGQGIRTSGSQVSPKLD